jgi:transcriptional regulator with XRE-family HTH domain
MQNSAQHNRRLRIFPSARCAGVCIGAWDNRAARRHRNRGEQGVTLNASRTKDEPQREAFDEQGLRVSLAANLRRLMAESSHLGTQRAVAVRCGVAQTTIARVLAGEVAATLDTLHRLAVIFKVSPAVLIATDEQESELLQNLSEIRQSPEDVGHLMDYSEFLASRYIAPLHRLIAPSGSTKKRGSSSHDEQGSDGDNARLPRRRK